MSNLHKIRVIVLTLLMMMVLVACGSKTNEVDVAIEKDSVGQEEELDQLDSMADIEVDKGLFNVVLTIPADFVGEEATQEELDQQTTDKGYKSIILNEDGSATYTMTKKQHNELVSEIKKNLDTSLQEMVASEEFPNIVSIDANKNYTEFKIVTKNEELDMSESFSILAFYMYGGAYNIFNGTVVDNVNVKFINESSGAIISESNSKDM